MKDEIKCGAVAILVMIGAVTSIWYTVSFAHWVIGLEGRIADLEYIQNLHSRQIRSLSGDFNYLYLKNAKN